MLSAFVMWVFVTVSLFSCSDHRFAPLETRSGGLVRQEGVFGCSTPNQQLRDVALFVEWNDATTTAALSAGGIPRANWPRWRSSHRGAPVGDLWVTGITPVTGTQIQSQILPHAPPISSSVLPALGQPPPTKTFPPFTDENPQLWCTLPRAILSHVFNSRNILGAYVCSEFLGSSRNLASICSEEISRHGMGLNYLSIVHPIWSS